MSAFAQNPFALLGDDGEDVKPQAAKPKAAAVPSPAAATTAATKPAAAARNNGANGNQRGQQQRSSKPVNADRELNAEVPAAGDLKEDRAKNFGGRGGARGGRGGGRGGANPRSNAGTYLGGDRPRREKGPGGTRAFDRQSQTGHKDSDKQEAQGWGADEGKQELEAETLGEVDAQAEGAATPAAATGTQTPARVEEEEDNTQTYEEYLAAQAAKKLNISLPEARRANDGDDDDFKGTKLVRKEDQDYDEFLADKKEKKQATKERKAKQLLEVEFTAKPTPGQAREGAPRGGRGGRGGPRGGGRGGRGEGRGGARGGRGQGPARGGNNNASSPAVNLSDNTAFPSL